MNSRFGITQWRAAAALLALAAAGCASAPVQRFDVVVYGGTAGGAVAAIAAAGAGARVALLEPGRHIGGMVSGGLGATDHGRKEVVGGLSRQFFERVGRHYGQPIAWRFEPHVAEGVFRDWLTEAGVTVRCEQRLSKLTQAGARLVGITTRNGERYAASVFVDASYEGNLMARAGLPYTWGREGQAQYGESLAGRRERSEFHQFQVAVSPYREATGETPLPHQDTAAGTPVPHAPLAASRASRAGTPRRQRLLPFVYGGDPGAPGQADKKVQAYNFRLCMTNRPGNRVPWPKPAGYAPTRYELLRRYLLARPGLKMKDLMNPVPMPNDKTDTNNNGPFSTDHIGGSWDYPEGDEAKRQAIWQDHVNYQQGFLYFLANDPGVPRPLHDEINQWGLARDEFVDTGHWPHQLYIREARRMLGAYVMIQPDLQTARTKPDSIGMGSYNSDSHHVQRIPTAEGAVINEGDMQVPVKPYEIAYRAITPRPQDCTNLLVPVCVSASHVAYSSLRMEPVYMIMGHAAGLAAAEAARTARAVQDIDVPTLQRWLREQGQVLNMAEAIKSTTRPAAIYD